MSETSQRTVTGVCLAVVLGLLFYLGSSVTVLGMMLIVALVLLELWYLFHYSNYNKKDGYLYAIAALFAILFMYTLGYAKGKFSYDDSVNLSVVIFITMLSVAVSDVAAYFAGRKYGKSLGQKLFGENYKLAPILSPNKTKVGALAGFFAGAVVFATLFSVWLNESVVFSIILGSLAVILGMCGDLFESRLKRGAGLKDSGIPKFTKEMLPGHGGFADRFDSHIPAVCIVLVVICSYL